MEPAIVIAAIGAIPASLGAWAAVLAATRSGTGNRDIRALKRMLQSHIEDRNVHYIEERRNGVVRKGGSVS